MSGPDSTCWTLVRAAAEGRPAEREEFARRYVPIVRAFLGARWRGTRLVREIDDAVQDVFVDCARREGPLARVDDSRPGGFRAFLYGVVSNVARRIEETAARRARERQTDSQFDFGLVQGREATAPQSFDRMWATSIMREAAVLQTRYADGKGPDAVMRVEMLRMRFVEDLPVREIAKRMDVDPARAHHQYAQAREEFRSALAEVVRFHHSEDAAAIDLECARLLESFR